jgi:hypothetical protein
MNCPSPGKGEKNMNDIIFELPKNSRETIRFSLAEYKGRRFGDLRIFLTDEGQDPIATRKGLTVSPQLWPQFKAALAQLESAMVAERWIDAEDLEALE